MAYPFYLGENFNSTAASRDLVGFSNLVKRNVDVILNTPGERATVRKLRVSAVISLVVRAVYRTGAEPEKIQELGTNCYKKLAKLSAGQRAEIKNLLVAFSEDAIRLVPETVKPHPSLLQRFFDEIGKATVESATVSAVASALGVNPSHLCRAIKTATGRTPSEYIRRAKLARARELLVNSSVTQAGLDSGFSKISAFIALFRKHYGETPKEYKKRMQANPPGFSPEDQIRGIVGRN